MQSRARRWTVTLCAMLLAAGCGKSQSYFFHGELTEAGPKETNTFPVFLQREFLESQQKIVETNYQTFRGVTRNFNVVYDFKSGKIEMKENGAVTASGTFNCERSGAGLDTLTTCTCDLKTPQGDVIHAVDSYEGTAKVSFHDELHTAKGKEDYLYTGDVVAMPEEEFRRQLKLKIPNSGGCQVGPPTTESPGAGTFAAGFALLLSTAAHRARRRRRPDRETV